MVIYLKHPIHGTKVAIAENEAEEDEKNGWVVYNPNIGLNDIKLDSTVNGLVVKRRRS
jgi:hypothetical protein